MASYYGRDDQRFARNSHNPAYAGYISIKSMNDSLQLTELNEHEKVFVARYCKPPACERVYRYHTDRSLAAGLTPLIKINADKNLVYFLTADAYENGTVAFETRGVKAQFINLIIEQL